MNKDIDNENHKEATEENLFKDLSDGMFFVNSPCFLTVPERTIKLNGLYLKAEGIRFDPVKILHIHYENQFIYLLVKDLKTDRIYQISHIIGENYPCIWWLQDWDFIENQLCQHTSNKILDDDLLEFDF
ncbi:MAG: hypothetical protein JSV24_00990 [Bacteroidales bacterium]|nr:MAG: hypothetical protein JSV24_00990 [Bacteroidales bacterium]